MLCIFSQIAAALWTYFFASLGLYLREKEREREKTDSTQKQVIYTDQPLFPQRLLTFLPYVTISNQCLKDWITERIDTNWYAVKIRHCLKFIKPDIPFHKTSLWHFISLGREGAGEDVGKTEVLFSFHSFYFLCDVPTPCMTGWADSEIKQLWWTNRTVVAVCIFEGANVCFSA